MKKSHSVISTGTASIVLIFVMLCMLTFSVLSLVSAQANLRLSQKSAERTTEYYQAENAANDILIQMEDAAPFAAASSGGDALAMAQVILDGLDSANAVTLQDGRLCYQVPLGEEQLLAVALTPVPEGLPDGRYCRIDVWQTVSRYDWVPDDSLNLFDPDVMFADSE